MNSFTKPALDDVREPALQPLSRPLSLQLVRNVTFTITRKLVSGPIFLLLVPFILHRVGSVGYGVWSIMGMMMGLGWILDLGLSGTVMKFVAEYRGRGEASELKKLLDTGSCIYLLVAALWVGLLWIFSRQIIGELFRGPQAPSVAAVLPLWNLLLPLLAIDLLLKPVAAVINGCQRLDLVNVLIFCGATTDAVLIVALLLLGGKVAALLWAALLGQFVALVIALVIAHRLIPSIIPNPFGLNLAMAKRISIFSLGLYSGPLMGAIQGQIEKLYLARFVGIIPVGWYGIASDAASKIRRVPDLMLAPVMAASSELHAADQRRKTAQLYFRSQKYTAVITVPLVVFALVASKPLIALWLGPKLGVIVLPFAILAAAILFSQAGLPIYSVITGQGVLRPSVYTALLTGFLNLVLSLFFIMRWGFLGAAWGSALPIVIANVYYFSVTQKYLDIPFFTILRRAYLKPVLSSLAAAAVVYGINLLPIGLWTKVLAGTALFGILYLTGLALSRFFDEFDFSKLEAHMPFARHARRLILVAPAAEN